jgi:hypothetical protein
VLGESRARVIDALVRAAPALAAPGSIVDPLIDTGESGIYPARGGPFGGLELGPPLSCDMPPVQAGAPRFPIAQWEANKRHGWLVSGSPECAADVTAELSAAHTRGVVALTLEAAALPAHATSLHVITASAGVIPETGESAAGRTDSHDARDDELHRFESTLGRISWWTALGRDAATLARLALRHLPPDLASDARSVAERRSAARDQVAAAITHLWSTEASGWGGSSETQRMRRTVCAVDVTSR